MVAVATFRRTFTRFAAEDWVAFPGAADWPLLQAVTRSARRLIPQSSRLRVSICMVISPEYGPY